MAAFSACASLHAAALPPAPAQRRLAAQPAAPQAWRPSRRQLRLQVSAASSASSSPSSSSSTAAPPAVAAALDTLLKAAADASVPPKAVFGALRDLEQAKVKLAADWPAIIGGTAPPGNRWRLVFTSGTKQVQEALKDAGKGGGAYFPLTAVQRWDAASGEIENGIFLGRLAALTFKGPYAMDGKVLAFDFDTLTLRLGGLKLPIPLKGKVDPSTFKRGKDSPFFVFFYVDDRIICARGRGGGIAVWARTSPQWELEKGVV